jgi:hypothetical protein
MGRDSLLPARRFVDRLIYISQLSDILGHRGETAPEALHVNELPFVNWGAPSSGLGRPGVAVVDVDRGHPRLPAAIS